MVQSGSSRNSRSIEDQPKPFDQSVWFAYDAETYFGIVWSNNEIAASEELWIVPKFISRNAMEQVIIQMVLVWSLRMKLNVLISFQIVSKFSYYGTLVHMFTIQNEWQKWWNCEEGRKICHWFDEHWTERIYEWNVSIVCWAKTAENILCTKGRI